MKAQIVWSASTVSGAPLTAIYRSDWGNDSYSTFLLIHVWTIFKYFDMFRNVKHAKNLEYITHVTPLPPSPNHVKYFRFSDIPSKFLSTSYIVCHCTALILLSDSSLRQIIWLYPSLTAHQHQKGLTVPKKVSPLEKNGMVLQSENCTV